MAKISFVVPVYNTERFLAATLESILSQTHRDIEVICVNDCSTDSSPQILEEYAGKDSRLRWISAPKNGGVSRARNLGLDEVKGDWVWCFDSDDLLHPQAAEFMLRACEEHGADFAYTPVERVAEEATQADCTRPIAYTVEEMAYATDPYRLYPKNYYGMQHILVKASLVKDVRFEPGVTYAEDALFSYGFLVNGPKGVYIHEPLVYYRQRESSAVHSLGGAKKVKSIDKVVECLKPMLMRDMPSEIRTVLSQWLTAHDVVDLPLPYSTEPCYAVKASDEVRAKSTSGGVFTLLAEDVLSRGGLVAGAVWNKADWSVEHVLAETVEGIAPMRGSKYVRGVLGREFMQRMEAALKAGREVLFTGLPCQVAAIKKRFGEYPNLLTMDIICHGAPDGRFWQKRVKELTADGKKITSVNFRDKRMGWGLTSSTFSAKYADGTEYSDYIFEDPYGKAFGANLILSESCARCPYACEKRNGDLTAADFWDLANRGVDDRRGISSVVVNTVKGRIAFERIRARFAQVMPYPVSTITQPNFHRPTRPHPMAAEFQRDVLSGEKTFAEAIETYASHPKAVGILNFHWEQRNFGALLTSFALSRHLRDTGWNPQNIDYSPLDPGLAAMRENTGFERFRARHLPRTRLLTDGRRLKTFTAAFQTFIVGSDQVWSQKLTTDKEDAFYLSFAGYGKRLISAAGSFGKVPASERDAEELKARLGVFSAISVREEKDAETVKSLVGKGECVPDPVFWVEPSVWTKLADEAKRKIEGEVVVYCVNNAESAGLMKFLEGSGLTSIEKPARILSSSLTPEEWLAAIRSARLVVTDSFHGTCFSILYHAPFVCIHADENRSARHRTLLGGLGLSDHLFSSAEAALEAYRAGMTVDWDAVEKGIASYRERGQKFIADALATNDMESPEMQAAWERLEEYRKAHPCWQKVGAGGGKKSSTVNAEKAAEIWKQRCKFLEERNALRQNIAARRAREADLWAKNRAYVETCRKLRESIEERKAREARLWEQRKELIEARNALRGAAAAQRERSAAIWAQRCKFLEERDKARGEVAAHREREARLWKQRGELIESRKALRAEMAAQREKASAVWEQRCKFQEERNQLRREAVAQKEKEARLWKTRCELIEARNALRAEVAARREKESAIWAQRCKFLEERDRARGEVAVRKAEEARLLKEREELMSASNALRGEVAARKEREAQIWRQRCKFMAERDALLRAEAERKAKWDRIRYFPLRVWRRALRCCHVVR